MIKQPATERKSSVYIYWFKKWFQKPVWFLLANRAVFRWKQFIMHYLLLQIILAAVSITLLQECQGFPNENWPFFFLMLQSCILVRLLLLHWCKSQSPNFLVLGKWKHERVIKLSLSPHLWKIKLLWYFGGFFLEGRGFLSSNNFTYFIVAQQLFEWLNQNIVSTFLLYYKLDKTWGTFNSTGLYFSD